MSPQAGWTDEQNPLGIELPNPEDLDKATLDALVPYFRRALWYHDNYFVQKELAEGYKGLLSEWENVGAERLVRVDSLQKEIQGLELARWFLISAVVVEAIVITVMLASR